MILTTAFLILLLVLSGLTSGTETAMTAASRGRLSALASEGNRRARVARHLLEERERLISTLLIGNNLWNILAAALATDLFLRLVGEAGIAVATFVMTVLVVIFGEVLPKTYAIRHPETFALNVAPAVRAAVLLLTPVTKVLGWVINLLLRSFGAATSAAPLAPAYEEIRSQIELHKEEGEIAKHDRDMLGGILDLGEVPVADIMTHRRDMVTIDASASLDETVKLVEANPFTRFPVWRDDPDQIVGYLHARDLLVAVKRAQETATPVDIDALLSEPWFIPDTTSLKHQLLAFRQRRQHLAMVVDEYGSLMGLVTLEDIIEEIVGDIVDEKDVEVPGVRVQADGSLLVDGKVTVRDLNRQFDWRLPDDEAATIAGLVIHEAQRIPEVGQAFSFHGFRFEVKARKGHQVTRLRLLPPPPAEGRA
ncbi:MAG: HlyC/CorC family transporter [Alphaproteobacteria bacterium]